MHDNNGLDEDDTGEMNQEQLDAMVQLHSRYIEGRLGGRRAALKNADLSGLSLRGKDLRQASFTGCNMTGMDLSGCDFQEATLYACDLSDSNISETKFIRSDLRGARIENSNLQDTNLEKADLRVGGFSESGTFDTGTAVSFRGANLAGARLVGTTASKADFSDAIMSGVNITSADLTGAQFDGADLSNAKIDGAQLSGANLQSTILTGVELNEIKCFGIDLSTAVTDENTGRSLSELDEPLEKLIEQHHLWVQSGGKEGSNLDLSNIDLRKMGGDLKMEKLTAIKAVNALFFGMNLYKLQLQSAVLDDSDFRNCDMEEADIRGSSFKNALFSHANMQKTNANALLFGAGDGTKRFSPCDFEGAKFRYTDLKKAQLKNAIFKNADLSYADLSGADLRDADFTGAIMKDAVLEGALMDGAKFDENNSKPVFRIPASEEDDGAAA